jgi:hypothetical protein
VGTADNLDFCDVSGAGWVAGQSRHVCMMPLSAAVLASNGQTRLVVSLAVAFTNAGMR